MIGQAIERMPPEDLAELRAITSAMRQRAERGESFVDEDRRFHGTLFRCLDNRMLIRLIEVFWLAFDRAADFFNTDNPDPDADLARPRRDRRSRRPQERGRGAPAARPALPRHQQRHRSGKSRPIKAMMKKGRKHYDQRYRYHRGNWRSSSARRSRA